MAPPSSASASTSTSAATAASSSARPRSSPATDNEIQLRYKLALPTFKALCAIQKSPERRNVLQTACLATEFRSFPIKQAEKALLREINDHTAIPYPIGEPITQPWHKAFLLVQVDLQRTGWPNKISANGRKELLQESGRIYGLLDRVLRCLVDILGQRQDGRGVTVALDVLRSIKAKVWEGNEMELLQVDGVGPAKMKKLVGAGVKNIKQLARLEFYHIERLLSRNPPFGHQMLHQLAGFPFLTLGVAVISRYLPSSSAAQDASNPKLSEPTSGLNERLKSVCHQLWIVKLALGYANENLPTWCKRGPWTTLAIEGDDGRLVWFWRGSVKRLGGGKEMAICLDVKKGEILKATFACEEIVGTMIRHTFTI